MWKGAASGGAHISRFPGAHWKARGKFGIGADRERHSEPGEQERPGRVAAGVTGDCADQRIDARSDGDADAIAH